jgi:hypothetical protein
MPAPSDRPAWLRRGWVRWPLLALGLYLLYALVTGVVAPPLVRTQAEQRLTRLTGGEVRIARLSFNPFTLRAAVRGFSLARPDGTPILTWSNVVADAQLSSLWRREAHLKSLGCDAVAFHFGRNRAGEFSLLELLRRVQANSPPPVTNAPPGKPFPLTVESFSFTNGVVTFRDESLAEPFALRLAPINVEARGLTTRGGGGGPIEFTAAGDGGERFAWSGRLGLNPPVAEGVLRGSGVPLARARPYTDPISPLRPTNGVAEFDLPYRLAIAGTNVSAALTQARLAVTGLALIEREDGRPFAELAAAEITGLDASLAEQSVAAGALRVDGATLHVRRSAGGESNVRGLVEPEVIEQFVRGFTGWRFALAELAVTNSAADLEDATLDPPVKLAVDQARLRATGLSNHTNGPPIALEAALRPLGAGEVRLRADATLFPARAEAKAEVDGFTLPPLTPYLAQFLKLTLNRGTLSARIEAAYGRTAETAPLLRAGGGLAVRDLAATETAGGTDFIRWDAVELTGLRATLQPNRLELDELAARRLQTSLILQTNGQLNVLGLLREAEEFTERERAAAPPPDAAATNAPPFWDQWPMQLGRLKLEEVALFAADNFVAGDFRTSIESLDGEVRNLALPPASAAEIDLRGRLTALSGFTLQGTLTPDPAAFATDLRLTTRRADLTQFTPYALRFAGYPVTRGTLDADVRYQVADGKLTAENRLLVDQFTFGAKTNSLDAINLPFKLGVALLKDGEGRIELDVPLTGTLSDPEFKLAPLIGQALKNIVLKAAAAPFKLLGALLGGDGGGEDLEFVEFAAGSAELTPDATNRCAKLVLALNQRPQLQLEVLGAFDAVADKAALARTSLEARLLALKAEETPGTPAAPLAPEERARLVRVAYERAFGAAPATPAPADPAAAAPTPGQLEQRLVETADVKPEALAALANGRAEAVKSFLIADGRLTPERVVVTPDAADHPGAGKAQVAFRLE